MRLDTRRGTLCVMDEPNQETADLGAAFRAARESAGLTLSEASYRLRTVLPAGKLQRTTESVRRYELGLFDPSDPVDVIVLLALAQVYGAELVKLTDDNRRDFDKLERLIRMTCFESWVAITGDLAAAG